MKNISGTNDSYIIRLWEKYKLNIWILDALPIVLIHIISIPFYIFESIDIFGIYILSLILLPTLLTIINYRIGLLRLEKKFSHILLITLLAVTTSLFLFFVPVLIDIFIDFSMPNKAGLVWQLVFILFSWTYTLLLGLISFGFYKEFTKRNKSNNSDTLVNIYEGTNYMVDFFKEILLENKIDSIKRKVSLKDYGLYVDKKHIRLADEIIKKAGSNVYTK